MIFEIEEGENHIILSIKRIKKVADINFLVHKCYEYSPSYLLACPSFSSNE